MKGHTGHEFVQTIRFDQPHEWGALGAMKTGTLDVAFTASSGLNPRQFIVYNNRALEDIHRPGIFYLTTSKFDEAIASQSRATGAGGAPYPSAHDHYRHSGRARACRPGGKM